MEILPTWESQTIPTEESTPGVAKDDSGTNQCTYIMYVFGAEQVLQWARTSPDIHTMLALDLTLYAFAVAIFKQQTADTLGINWE